MNWMIVATLFFGCGYERHQKKLDNQEFSHWYALRVYMTEEQRKTYLKMKTKEERNAYLKKKELWDLFYKYDQDIRDSIVAGEVREGWSRDMLEMAWGAPYDRQRAVGRQAQRSEKFIYRFEQQPDGMVLLWEPNSKTAYKAVRLFVKEVIIDDDVVVKISEMDASW
jgi:hypothetical protein